MKRVELKRNVAGIGGKKRTFSEGCSSPMF